MLATLNDGIRVRTGRKTERASEFIATSNSAGLPFDPTVERFTTVNYLDIVSKWAQEFQARRYIMSDNEIAAMSSDMYFDLIENENDRS